MWILMSIFILKGVENQRRNLVLNLVLVLNQVKNRERNLKSLEKNQERNLKSLEKNQERNPKNQEKNLKSQKSLLGLTQPLRVRLLL